MSFDENDREYILKVCCIGDGAVGKTSMVLQYCEKKFRENYIMTIGSNFAIKLLEFPDQDPPLHVRLQIWDLAGQIHFGFVRPMFYQGAAGLIYVFDLTRRESFESLDNWKEEAESILTGKPFAIVGNKLDLVDDRVVASAEGRKKAKEMGAIGYFETSAKTGENLDILFNALVENILKFN